MFFGIAFLIFVILLIIGVYKLMQDPFGFNNLKYSSKKELIENYETKQQEIKELYKYVQSITNNCENYVDIEFQNNKNIEIFRVKADSLENARAIESNSIVPKNGFVKSYYDVKINSKEVDTLLNRLEWTKETLITLKTKLDAANCISVESGEPVTIGFKRSGMGKYYYKIFDKLLTDNLIKKYNDGCTYIFYKDNIVLEYGGGVIGMQCFETFPEK